MAQERETFVQRLRGAFVRMLGARAVAMLIALAGMGVLARLLTPAAFGSFALGMAGFTVARTIAEFGLVEALVRRRNLTPRSVNAAYGLALASATTMAILGCVAVATLPVELLAEGLPSIVVFFAVALIADAVAMPYEAKRRREIEFGLLSLLAVGRSATEAGVAIALAAAGAGADALAAGFCASRILGAIVLVGATPRSDRARPTLRGARGFLSFGSLLIFSRLLPRAGELAVVALISRSLGIAMLGLYNRAGAIHAILDRTLFEAINPVILPALSRAIREDESPSRLYLHKIDYLTVICWPTFGTIALMADHLVFVLLGAQWEDCVPLVRIMALAGLASPFTKMSLKLFIAMNRLNLHLRIQAVHVACKLVLVGAGLLHSLEMAVAGIVLAHALYACMVWRQVRALSPFSVGAATLAFVRGCLATAATLGPLALVTFQSDLGSWVALLVALPLGFTSWALALVVMRHPLVADARALARGPKLLRQTL